MSFYDRHVLPRIVHLACSTRPAMRQRSKVVPRARGDVLEIGIGSGLNLPFYDPARVRRVWGLEPSPEMVDRAREVAEGLALDVEFIPLPGHELPLEDNSVDTVLTTYTLCTVPDPTEVLEQARRVLRPGGELIFCEHGAAPDRWVRRQQALINPVWSRLGGGCNLDRVIPDMLEAGGFKPGRLETGYIPGWRPACFNYWGNAVPR
ncbi:class I SAM-dependent methyltransferase [Wenzhouxiangella sp. XN24]|uniref:class I SAM-dependent methyltransferase n=1 Tax=Wenzhouxiangella sp. XN24 TaxID=2713569 RepID=UPI0013EB371F|nr:class I SAM-dependent methyltransferase [Wenzhouxiangella sp. XN24]NGX14788.1 class I SAM-dependent methyltransferase [Wenzhouxiangella sp. XN24]